MGFRAGSRRPWLPLGACHQPHRHADLHGAGDEHVPSCTQNCRDREFESHHEHEQDQSKFREKPRVLGGVDQVEGVRPQSHAHEEVAHDGGHSECREETDRQARRGEEDQTSGQEIVHF
jgi:hypothetical protein